MALFFGGGREGICTEITHSLFFLNHSNPKSFYLSMKRVTGEVVEDLQLIDQ